MAERRSVAADVVGSKPTSRPSTLFPDDSTAHLFFLSAEPDITGHDSQTVPRTMPTKKSSLAVSAPDAPRRLFAGTSGWAYPTWKPGFYPETLPQKSFLTFFASQLTSVEVNYTFRALPTAKIVADWIAATPENFRFSFKAPQRITHFARLKNASTSIAAFLASIQPMRDAGRLGLILFQLPPNFAADARLLAQFLADPALGSATGAPPPLAFEFRHPSWFTPEIRQVLSDHNAAVSIAESDDLVTPEIHTAATHTAYRLRRNGGYTATELASFAERLTALTRSRDTYVYFKHEDEPTGALNAQHFLKLAASNVEPLA